MMQDRYVKLDSIMKSCVRPPPFQPPVYERKFPKLPILPSYRGTFSQEFWQLWPENKTLIPNPWISPKALLDMAHTLGYKNLPALQKAVDILTKGAALGVTEAGRVPWVGENYATAFEHGHLVSDTICEWLDQGVMSGPWTEAEVAGQIPFLRIHPMSCQLKPTGAGRVIIDMSAPRKPPFVSINSTIDIEDFPVGMCSCLTVVDMLTEVGWCPDIMASKFDWQHAYKHVAISKDDAGLQWICWGGRLFLDLSLVFGASSSPSLYDAVAKVVLDLSSLLAGTESSRTRNQLDDAFTVDHCESAWRWFRSYESVCEALGVRLADKAKRDKVCPPSKLITLLGIEYDLSAWRWRMPSDKATKLLTNLYDAFSSEKVTMGQLLTLSGKINHYSSVVGGRFGRYERSFILYLTSNDVNKDELVVLNMRTRSQISWWIRMCHLGQSWSPLVDVRCTVPLTAISIHTDAAGGSPDSLNGMGGLVCLPQPVYFHYAWPSYVQMDTPNKEGIRFSRKMTFLESAAMLGGVLAAPVSIACHHVRLITDNLGCYWGWLKGHSRDEYAYSVIKAIHDVCAGLGVTLVVEYRPRRSDGPSCVADELSKARIHQAWDGMRDLGFTSPFRFANLARTFLAFMENPMPSRVLGVAILRELGTYTSVASVSPEWEEEVGPLVHYSICPDLVMY